MATKKTAKKAAAPKPAKVAKAAKEVVKKSNVKFVSFSLGAVIPVQSFGNVQPTIVVEAPTYEEAVAFAMPKLDELYAKYAEVKPAYLGKITETVKVVSGTTTMPAPAPTMPQAQDTPAPVGQDTPAPQATAQAPSKPKSDAVLKAEKAIGLAATEDALTAIQDQIEKSVKIAPEDKPALITFVLERRGKLK